MTTLSLVPLEQFKLAADIVQGASRDFEESDKSQRLGEALIRSEIIEMVKAAIPGFVEIEIEEGRLDAVRAPKEVSIGEEFLLSKDAKLVILKNNEEAVVYREQVYKIID